jgi:hypothetical protein
MKKENRIVESFSEYFKLNEWGYPEDAEGAQYWKIEDGEYFLEDAPDYEKVFPFDKDEEGNYPEDRESVLAEFFNEWEEDIFEDGATLIEFEAEGHLEGSDMDKIVVDEIEVKFPEEFKKFIEKHPEKKSKMDEIMHHIKTTIEDDIVYNEFYSHKIFRH